MKDQENNTIENCKPSAFDFCGIWSDEEFDETESLINQIRECRTFNMASKFGMK